MNLAEAMRLIEQKYHVMVSLELLHPLFLDSERLQLAPDQYLHHSPFCRDKKMSDGFSTCSAWKAKNLDRETCRFQTCPFGVEEYIAPFLYDGKTAAVLYFDITDKPAETRQAIPAEADFLLSFLQREFELLSYQTAGRKKRDENYYAEATRRFIDSHFSENIGLAELADTLRIHHGHLGEQLKKACGKSFRQMLTEKRIEESKIYLLRHKKLSIARIAAFCGFPDSNYFSAVFHRMTGMTPSRFRKKTDQE